MSTLLEKIQKLREQTNVSFNDIKSALQEAKEDEQGAILILKNRGKLMADKKASRETKEGIIAAYIHRDGKIGVLVELRCETDFVAKTEEYKSLAHDLAMHIAAMHPLYIRPEDIPEEILAAQKKEIIKEQGDISDTIMEEKIQEYYQETCLLHQYFVKDSSSMVKDYIAACIGKMGENIEISRFVYFAIS